jgi:lipoprotein-releasing system ATP-binding protein
MSNVLNCRNLGKTYSEGRLNLTVLSDVSLSVDKGERLAIVGASGSGKSTLLHLLGGLDTPSQGVWKCWDAIWPSCPRPTRRMRNQSLGFVYQFHHLLPEFSALENVMMPLLIRRLPQGSRRACRQHADAASAWPSACSTSRASCPVASASVLPLPVRW